MSEHNHANKEVLDQFGEIDGELYYNGQVIKSVGDLKAHTSKHMQDIEQGNLYTIKDKLGRIILPLVNANSVYTVDGKTVQEELVRLNNRGGVGGSSGHYHGNFNTLDKLGESNNQLTFNGKSVDGHSHDNKLILDEFSEYRGSLYYKGEIIGKDIIDGDLPDNWKEIIQGIIDSKLEDNVVDDSSFPDTLPEVPVIKIKSYFNAIDVSWTYEGKAYYNYELYASQERNFIVTESTLIYRGQASSFLFNSEPEQVWYFKVRARNTHGNATDFSNEIEASSFKIGDAGEYFEEASIGSAMIREINADLINAGTIKGHFLEMKNAKVVDGNDNVTFGVDEEGQVEINAKKLTISNSPVTTDKDVDAKLEIYDGSIKTHVSEQFVETNNRFGVVESEIQQAKDQIAMKVNNTDVYLKDEVYSIEQTESLIDQRANEISLNVSQTTVETALGELDETFNELDERIMQAQAQININADGITQTVKKEDYTGETVVSMINQTADSIKIQAENIELKGSVVIDNNGVEIFKIEDGGVDIEAKRFKLVAGGDSNVPTKEEVTEMVDNLESSYSIILSNEAQVIPTNPNRYPLNNKTYTTSITVYQATKERLDYTIGNIASANGITVTKTNNSVSFAVSTSTTLTVDDGIFTIPITIDGRTFNKAFSWACSKQGITGANGVNGNDGTNGTNGVNAMAVDIVSTSQVFKSTNGGKTFTPTTITLTPVLQYCTYSKWQYSTNGGDTWTNVSSGSNGLTIVSGALTINNTSSLFTTSTTSVSFKVLTNNSLIYDTMTIIKLYDVVDLTQTDIFNKLTNNGQTQGLYLENGKVYLNAEYMKTGSLNANLVNIDVSKANLLPQEVAVLSVPPASPWDFKGGGVEYDPLLGYNAYEFQFPVDTMSFNYGTITPVKITLKKGKKYVFSFSARRTGYYGDYVKNPNNYNAIFKENEATFYINIGGEFIPLYAFNDVTSRIPESSYTYCDAYIEPTRDIYGEILYESTGCGGGTGFVGQACIKVGKFMLKEVSEYTPNTTWREPISGQLNLGENGSKPLLSLGSSGIIMQDGVILNETVDGSRMFLAPYLYESTSHTSLGNAGQWKKYTMSDLGYQFVRSFGNGDNQLVGYNISWDRTLNIPQIFYNSGYGTTDKTSEPNMYKELFSKYANPNTVVVRDSNGVATTSGLHLKNGNVFISQDGGATNYPLIDVRQGDQYGSAIGVGSGGLGVYGGGESAQTVLDNLNNTHEHGVLSADINAIMYSNLQEGWANRHWIELQNNGNATVDGYNIPTVRQWNDGVFRTGSWCRLFHFTWNDNATIGGSFMVNVSYTRGNVVNNVTCLVNGGHNYTCNITQLGNITYSRCGFRGVVDANGQGYFEIWENATDSAGVEQSGVRVTVMPIRGLHPRNITAYNYCNYGGTIPANHSVGSGWIDTESGNALVTRKLQLIETNVNGGSHKGVLSMTTTGDLRCSSSSGWFGTQHLYCITNASYDIGSGNYRYRTVYSYNALNTSDERDKENIIPLNGFTTLSSTDEDSELYKFFRDMPLYEYDYTCGGDGSHQTGYLAQEVMRLNPTIASRFVYEVVDDTERGEVALDEPPKQDEDGSVSAMYESVDGEKRESVFMTSTHSYVANMHLVLQETMKKCDRLENEKEELMSQSSTLKNEVSELKQLVQQLLNKEV